MEVVRRGLPCQARCHSSLPGPLAWLTRSIPESRQIMAHAPHPLLCVHVWEHDRSSKAQALLQADKFCFSVTEPLPEYWHHSISKGIAFGHRGDLCFSCKPSFLPSPTSPSRKVFVLSLAGHTYMFCSPASAHGCPGSLSPIIRLGKLPSREMGVRVTLQLSPFIGFLLSTHQKPRTVTQRSVQPHNALQPTFAIVNLLSWPLP